MEEIGENRSWLARGLEGTFKSALIRAYETVRVHPGPYLTHLRMTHGVAAASYQEMFQGCAPQLFDAVANQSIANLVGTGMA